MAWIHKNQDSQWYVASCWLQIYLIVKKIEKKKKNTKHSVVFFLFSALGDVAGIGWERTEGTPPPPGQPAKGRVYFTYCGQRLSPYLEDVSGGMWPVVHIQKKVGYLTAKGNQILFSNLFHKEQKKLRHQTWPCWHNIWYLVREGTTNWKECVLPLHWTRVLNCFDLLLVIFSKQQHKRH